MELGKSVGRLALVAISVLVVATISFSGAFGDTSAGLTCSPTQVFGVVTYWKYKFLTPQGYWQCPGQVLQQEAVPKGFTVTFFKSKDDIPSTLEEAEEKPLDAFFQLTGGPKAYARPGDYFAKVYTDPQLQIKEIPKPLRARFLKLKTWSCKYITPSRAYGGFYSIACFSVRDKAIRLSIVGRTEKDVLDKAPILRNMVGSFQEQLGGDAGDNHERERGRPEGRP